MRARRQPCPLDWQDASIDMHPKRPERTKRLTRALERPLEDSLVRIKALAQDLAHKVIAIL